MENNIKLKFDNNFVNEEKEVIDQLIFLQQSLCAKDIKNLSKVLHENFILVRGSGRKESKDDFLTDIKEDVLNYVETTIKNPKININDNIAEIKAKIYIKTEVAGAQIIWDLKSKFILEKFGEEWIFIEWDTA